jgi:tetratricopeptide (TPR) repeat protein
VTADGVRRDEHHRRRTLVFVLLLGAYGVVLGGWTTRRPAAFDPLAPQPHAIEQLIVAGKFAEALPQVEALGQRYPHEGLVSLWLARAHHGLGHWRSEAAAWEEVVRWWPAPQESCPFLPEAYERAGDEARALAAFERCTRFDPSDSSPFSDLAAAFARRGRTADAVAAYRHAAELEPDDPVIRRRLESISAPDARLASERQP